MPGLDNPAGSIISGRQVVSTNGTRVQLSTTSTAVLSVAIQAETDNTNPVTVGGADVVGALATRKGIALSAGASISLDVNDLAKVYIDSITNGEGVTYIATVA